MANGLRDSTHGFQKGAWMPHHNNGLQQGTQAGCLTGLYFNREQKLWTLAFVLALLKTWLNFFHGETYRDRTLGRQEENLFNFVSSIKFTAKPHPLMWVSEDTSSGGTARTHFPPMTRRSHGMIAEGSYWKENPDSEYLSFTEVPPALDEQKNKAMHARLLIHVSPFAVPFHVYCFLLLRTPHKLSQK